MEKWTNAVPLCNFIHMKNEKLVVRELVTVIDPDEGDSIDSLLGQLTFLKSENPDKNLYWIADKVFIEVYSDREETDAEYSLRKEQALHHKKKLFNKLKQELGEYV